MSPLPIILASKSQARRAVLTGAGVSFSIADSEVDEGVIKTRVIQAGGTPKSVAEVLAETKAVKVSQNLQGLVIGADQTLEYSGQLYDKASTLTEARERLRTLRGVSHSLHSAVAVAEEGAVIWRETVSARLTMRSFSDMFLEAYLKSEGQHALGSVGCYRLEGLGAQLFSDIQGDYFTILGLPLMGLLDLLRRRGAIVS